MKIDTLTRIQTYHASMFADYLDKLRSTADGDGSLLDHSLILYGSNAAICIITIRCRWCWRAVRPGMSRGTVI